MLDHLLYTPVAPRVCWKTVLTFDERIWDAFHLNNGPWLEEETRPTSR